MYITTLSHSYLRRSCFLSFLFNVPPTAVIYRYVHPLTLLDALPISRGRGRHGGSVAFRPLLFGDAVRGGRPVPHPRRPRAAPRPSGRLVRRLKGLRGIQIGRAHV